ncbi:pilus assembly protein N-terminal domain-containing protein [Parvularcula dongshanensis]|uniref:Pilus formation protein N-terminal domain-containing protein n=1 Tax=Parvularcula dongshanensis TaxID=1173995 RepID=A0A840I0E0_9PROT|nr:pilus assembly protein N-terminal domain-containing protein [Parvularcula dongshanensis]MBB4657743.1 hypothetical protein [Parvularcula dongshanensis]
MNRHALISCLGAAVLASAPSVADAGEVWLSLDTNRTFTLPVPVGKIVIANPAVADVQVLSSTELLMFGKMPGDTAISFYDRAGKRLDDVTVRVGNSRKGRLTLQNGPQRYTFSCTDRCEQTPVYGDGALLPAQALMGMAQARAAAASQPSQFGAQAVAVAEPEETPPAEAADAGSAPASSTKV